jgi:hypothetical protein
VVVGWFQLYIKVLLKPCLHQKWDWPKLSVFFFFSLVLFVILRNKETLQAGGDVGDSEKDTEHSSQATRDWQETLLALMANQQKPNYPGKPKWRRLCSQRP